MHLTDIRIDEIVNRTLSKRAAAIWLASARRQTSS